MRLVSFSLLTALVVAGASGCAPALTAASSTPAGQAAIERAVQSALVRSGLAEPTALADVEAVPAQLLAGPMLADVTHRSAVVWVQTDGPAEVGLRYVATATDDPSVSPEAAPVDVEPRWTTAEGGYTATFRLADLEPGWTYRYSVVIGGTPVARPYPTTITTQPLWQWRTDPPAFTVAFGSCHYANDPAYDRPGTPYGGSTAIFEAIRAKRPDLMLWLGDNVYLREVDWWSTSGIEYRYRHARQGADLQALLAAAPHYATWDDHDYGPNDSDRSFILKGASLETFERYWPGGPRGLPGVPGVFTQFQWGDADFFVLDDRFHRSPNEAPPGEQTMLGPVQLQWLLDALTTSQAPFKLVAIGGQVLNPVPAYETYASVAPVERQYLLDQIAARGIDGVVFLTGDRHHTELIRIDRAGTYPLYDFTSSPLTAGPSTYAAREDSPEYNNPARVPGTLVAGPRGFGTLTFTGPRTDRTMTMRAFDAEGTLRWEHALRANDLVTPGE